VQPGEVGVRGRRVDHQQPGGLGTGVAEGVGSAARDEHEALASDGELVAVDDDGDHPVENEVGLGAVRVAVRRRTASARGQGALHQRQVTAVELGGGLEEHLAAASTVVRVTFAGTKNHRGRLLTSMLHGIAQTQGTASTVSTGTLADGYVNTTNARWRFPFPGGRQ
jgi:hypothetical protein